MVQQSLEDLREECRRKAEDPADPPAAKQCLIVVEHLDRYCDDVVQRGLAATYDESPGKPLAEGETMLPQANGRKKLTREFQCLPPEVMLVPNLQNPEYVERVLGDLSELPVKLAQAAQSAPPWTQWRKGQKPINTGRLPQGLLRRENVIDNLVVIYHDQCRSRKQSGRLVANPMPTEFRNDGVHPGGEGD